MGGANGGDMVIEWLRFHDMTLDHYRFLTIRTSRSGMAHPEKTALRTMSEMRVYDSYASVIAFIFAKERWLAE